VILDIALPFSYEWILLGSRLLVAVLLLLFFWRVLITVQRESALNVAGGRQMMLGLLDGADQIVRGFRLSRRKPMLIGRDAEADIVVTDRSVSGRHAVVRYTEGEWTVADLESRNGTFVNGQLIVSGIPILEGDVVQCGAVRFLLVHDESGF
jgi:pSer/pThr/pTyr-binding forkhead associated (FHA) protein